MIATHETSNPCRAEMIRELFEAMTREFADDPPSTRPEPRWQLAVNQQLRRDEHADMLCEQAAIGLLAEWRLAQLGPTRDGCRIELVVSELEQAEFVAEWLQIDDDYVPRADEDTPTPREPSKWLTELLDRKVIQ